MKIVLILILLSNFCFGQVDMLQEGFQSGLKEDEYAFVTDLFLELEKFTFDKFELDKSYEQLAAEFCALDDFKFLAIKPNSRLDKLIKKGIKNQFWTREDPFEDEKKDDFLVLQSDTLRNYKIAPPVNHDTLFTESLKIELLQLNHKSNYISCSKDYTFHRGIAHYLKEYKRYKMINSEVKLCGMLEFINETDFNIFEVKHFILIHCITQKILEVNNYVNE